VRQVALELALEELNLRAGELIERLGSSSGVIRVGDDQDPVLRDRIPAPCRTAYPASSAASGATEIAERRSNRDAA
jgi:hypothetical protein